MIRSVLFVCLGNICRSPAAEAIFKDLAEKKGLTLRVESAGLGNWHVGKLPDERMCEASADRGIILSSRAKQFSLEFLDEFDLILALDKTVLEKLYHFTKNPEQKAKIQLATAFSQAYKDQDVPDPYYGGRSDFDLVLDMLEESSEELLSKKFEKLS